MRNSEETRQREGDIEKWGHNAWYVVQYGEETRLKEKRVSELRRTVARGRHALNVR